LSGESIEVIGSSASYGTLASIEKMEYSIFAQPGVQRHGERRDARG
jgi:hypothetical protein